MQTLVDNEEPNLDKHDAIDYLSKKGRENFTERRTVRGERIGQAWFNSLSVDDQDKLKGALYDPFYKDSWPDVLKALRFLLEN